MPTVYCLLINEWILGSRSSWDTAQLDLCLQYSNSCLELYN